MRYLRECWTIWFSLVIVMIATCVLFALGEKNWAWVMGQCGTVLVLLGNVFYIAIRDPKRKWPNDPWHVRVSNLMTFKR